MRRKKAGFAGAAVAVAMLWGLAAQATYIKGVSTLYPFRTATIEYRVESSEGAPATERLFVGDEDGRRYFRFEQYDEGDGRGRETARVVEGTDEGTRVSDYLAGTSYVGPVLYPWQVIPYLNGDLPSALRGQVVDVERYLGRDVSLLVVTGTDVKYRIWLWGPVALRTEITPLRRDLGPTIVVEAVDITVDRELPAPVRIYPRIDVVIPIPVPIIRTRPLYYPYPYRYPYREYRYERRYERRYEPRYEPRREPPPPRRAPVYRPGKPEKPAGPGTVGPK